MATGFWQTWEQGAFWKLLNVSETTQLCHKKATKTVAAERVLPHQLP